MARRTPETLADYLVVAICPALIMLLVGSLLYFLVEVFYQGQFELKLLWVLAMFVLGIVCLARLSMEEGYAYASMYAVPLGVLVGIALTRFVQFGGPLASFSLLVNWGLMAWVWWCAHKLTWDCTLIDDSQDASGEGLLQQMGLDNEADGGDAGGRASAAGPEATTAAPEAATPSQPESANKEWWKKWFEPDLRPHPPGVWVVYFSLGALPMFGIGGRFIATDNLDSRRWCFNMLVIYVATAMALLLATSFLGLRKYLRQRRLEMPLEMAAAWVGVGLVLIVATIVVAALLPRPSPEYSIAHIIKIDSPDLWASRVGFGTEGAKNKPDSPSSSGAPQQEGQQADQQGGGKPDPNNKNGEPTDGKKGQGGGKEKGSQQGQSKSDSSQSDSSKSSSSQQSQDQSKSQGNSQSNDSKSKPGDQSSQNSSQQEQSSQTNTKSKTDQSDQDAADKKPSQGQPGSDEQQKSQQQSSSSGSSASNSSPQPPQIMRHLQSVISAVGGILKALFYLAIAIAAVILAWRYRAELLAAWKKLLAELAALWPSLFGKKDQAPTSAESTAPAPPRPFAQFADPFASGQAARMSPAEVVRYTFAALEAWGRENGCPRAIGQTPHEYAAAIGQLDQSVGREAAQLADLYARMAYAPPAAIRTSFEPLRALWRKMTSPAVEIVGV